MNGRDVQMTELIQCASAHNDTGTSAFFAPATDFDSAWQYMCLLSRLFVCLSRESFTLSLSAAYLDSALRDGVRSL